MVIVLVGGAYLWAGQSAAGKLRAAYSVHTVEFPVPFPLDSSEARRLRLNPEGAARVARERAMERGQHLVEARYACVECHGRDFSGGVMIDAAPIGRLFGPNLTAGQGGRASGFTPAEWDRIVRHGVRYDGGPSMMPSGDFERMTDQELSDIIVYVTAQPAVDNQVPPVTLGPVGKMLLATGRFTLSADVIPHDQPHAVYPPPAAVTVEFGRHLSGTCTGCHRPDLAGGPIVGGDPSWPPARNLTPHETGLAGWTYPQFVAVMREARRPDGTMVQAPMSTMPVFAQKMTDVELEALWVYLQSLPAVASRD